MQSAPRQFIQDDDWDQPVKVGLPADGGMVIRVGNSRQFSLSMGEAPHLTAFIARNCSAALCRLAYSTETAAISSRDNERDQTVAPGHTHARPALPCSTPRPVRPYTADTNVHLHRQIWRKPLRDGGIFGAATGKQQRHP